MSSTQVQWRRGTANQNATFIGATGEITVDIDNSRLIVHDNNRLGGWTGAKLTDLNDQNLTNSVYLTGTQTIAGAKTFNQTTSFNNTVLFNATLYDYSAIYVIDITHGKLQYVLNTTLDWSKYLLYDSSSAVSLDWNNKGLTGNWTLNGVAISTTGGGGSGIVNLPPGLIYNTGVNQSISGNLNIQTGTIKEVLNFQPIISGNNFTLSNKPFYINTGIISGNWTLPSISFTTGRSYLIKNRGNTVILTGTYPNQIYTQYPVDNFNINSGESYTVINDGVYWNIL